MRIVREELHRQADYLRAVESKNAKLMAEVNVLRTKETSVEVLREEKRGLERKVRVMEELREKVVRLEAELEAGRREREAWFVPFFFLETPQAKDSLFQGEQHRWVLIFICALQDSCLYNQASIRPPTSACPIT
jgi:hypothetical protein